jgi:hypothetical protein
MNRDDRSIRRILFAIVVLLAVLVLRQLLDPQPKVLAQAPRYDHLMIVSTGFLYKGQQGMLVLDKRNANVWFFARINETFQDPVLVIRLPFEKIDTAR